MTSKILYHGTVAKFEKFDLGKIGSHTTGEGFGFYFTDNLQLAESYAEKTGVVLSANVSIKKSLSMDSLTITKNQLIKILKTVDPEGDGILSNWVDVSWTGYNKALRYVANEIFDYCENDVDLVCELITQSGNHRLICETIENQLGYNHTHIKNWNQNDFDVYVILLPEQIEIIKWENR